MISIADPRILTACAFYIVGGSAIALAIWVWRTHPVNRAFSLGPFVTEAGLRALLANVNAIFALGLFALSAGAARHLHWNAAKGCRSSDLANFFSLLETIFAVWAAGWVLVGVWRICRRG